MWKSTLSHFWGCAVGLISLNYRFCYSLIENITFGYEIKMREPLLWMLITPFIPEIMRIANLIFLSKINCFVQKLNFRFIVTGRWKGRNATILFDNGERVFSIHCQKFDAYFWKLWWVFKAYFKLRFSQWKDLSFLGLCSIVIVF